jgi:hypothetical protein
MHGSDGHPMPYTYEEKDGTVKPSLKKRGKIKQEQNSNQARALIGRSNMGTEQTDRQSLIEALCSRLKIQISSYKKHTFDFILFSNYHLKIQEDQASGSASLNFQPDISLFLPDIGWWICRALHAIQMQMALAGDADKRRI